MGGHPQFSGRWLGHAETATAETPWFFFPLSSGRRAVGRIRSPIELVVKDVVAIKWLGFMYTP